MSYIKRAFTDNNYKKWFYLGALFHLIAAIFSNGFHHWDEHFQIMEFLNFKLGNSAASDLPWEYHEKMRPWMQVFLYYLTSKALFLKDPFVMSFIFRLVSSVLGFLSLVYFFFASKDWIKGQYQVIYCIWLNTLWFLPYIHARHSGEGLGGSIFVLGLSLLILYREKTLTWLLTGLLFGLSFWLRYHIGIFILFLHIWLLINRENFKNQIINCLGVISIIGLGVLVDYWGYGEWIFTPYEYVYQNLILGKASGYGISPWYYYFTKTISKGLLPLSICFILGPILFINKNPKHLLSFLIIPFFIVHSLVGHKELRFIFPLAFLAPFFIVYVLDYFKKVWMHKLMYFVFVINLIALVATSQKPAHVSYNFYKAVKNLDIKMEKLLILGDTNPFKLAQLKVNVFNFHKPIVEFEDQGAKLELPSFVFGNRGKHYLKMKDMKGCKNVYSSLPSFLLSIKVGSWPSRSRFWSLFYCQNSL